MAGTEKQRSGPLSAKAFIVAFAVVGVAVVAVLLAAYQTCAFEGCPAIDQLQGYVPDEASMVVDRDGEEIGRLFRTNRVVIPLDSLPEHVPQAFIAIEDQEFYDHGGVDWSRAVGALLENIRSAGIEEGFSTITMQVARNVFPEQLPVQERTLNRKISEIRVARGLEGRYTKDEILALYLNQIYFGSGAWGIQSAAQEYFAKPAAELSVGEAALLAGLPKAPSNLNPRENMEGALDRRATVLRRMVSEGYITQEEADEIRGTEPEMGRSRVESADEAAYFMEHVRQIVEDRLGSSVYTEGYTIHTTLDLDAQAVAREELEEQADAIEAGRYGSYVHETYESAADDATGRVTPYVQGAVVVMDVGSGDVLALVGGRDFDESKFNRALQARRQPGSAFKPFVYAAALRSGYPPTTMLQDTPYSVVRDGREWSPENYGGSYEGPITMRQALTRSKNVATIRLAEQVGLGNVIDVARQLGLSGEIPSYPSIAIGAAEASLLELVTAYATFASLGDRPEPRYVTRVVDRNGNLVWRVPPRSRHVLESDVAFLAVDLMQDVVNRGTGATVRTVGFSGPAAGKTGTTNESADVWFVGFTPELVAGVWIGMDEPQRIVPNATGGRLAAPVWGRIMRRIDTGAGGWSPPPGVERHRVDEFGNVVASDCPTFGDVEEEYFIRGTVRPSDCRGYLGEWGDTLYPDSFYDDDRRQRSWWDRLRGRVLGEDEREGREDIDRRRARRDSLMAERFQDTIIRGPQSDTIPSDTGAAAPPDTGRIAPIPPDTTRRDPSPDTLIGVPRDSVPPDTGAAPPGASPPAPARNAGS